MKLILTNLKHFSITFLILLAGLVVFGLSIGANLHYNENDLAYTIDGEGPHIFIEGDSVVVKYIRGGRDEGFRVERHGYARTDTISVDVSFPLDGSSFPFDVYPETASPPALYDDGQPVFAVSDIESGFFGFRDLLIAHGVVDGALQWTYGRGHLVLVGDFVDRGASTTQVLWFIYKLENEARAQGGHVHFILGNHELKTLYGDYEDAAPRYGYAAAILGMQHSDLYGDDALLGRWMTRKNMMERINGNLFVHGGLHPGLAELGYSVEDVNGLLRPTYRQAYFPRPDRGDEDLLLSARTGPMWYRGYFKDSLSQDEVARAIEAFGAESVVVGHTLQRRVRKLYDGRVFAIDVRHPNDYESNFPPPRSEGLIIEDKRYYRALENGARKEL